MLSHAGFFGSRNLGSTGPDRYADVELHLKYAPLLQADLAKLSWGSQVQNFLMAAKWIIRRHLTGQALLRPVQFPLRMP
jgi:hypothetical protein